MGNTVQLTKNGQPVFPVTDVSLVMGLQDAIKLPPVKVTTLPTASAETAGKMYYVGPDANDEYERYITSATGGSYEWIDLGDTSIPLPSIADNLVTDDANTALSARQGKVLNEEISELEHKVDEIATGKFYGYHPAAADLPEGDVPGYAYVGTESPYSIYNFDGTTWTDSGATVKRGEGQIIYLEDFPGYASDLSPVAMREFLQSAIDYVGQNKAALVFPKGVTFVVDIPEAHTTVYDCEGGDGLQIPSDILIDFNYSTIKADTNHWWCYNIIHIMQTSKNVTLKNGYIVGDRDTHVMSTDISAQTRGTTDEWHYCIRVNGPGNVQVLNMNCSDVRGDGISIEGKCQWNHTLAINGANILSGQDVDSSGALVAANNYITTTLLTIATYFTSEAHAAGLKTFLTPRTSIDRAASNKECSYYLKISYYTDADVFISSETLMMGGPMNIPDNAVKFRITEWVANTADTFGFWVMNTMWNETSLIRGCEVTRCGRNGILPTVCRSLVIEQCKVSKIYGTNNNVAIDIEGTSYVQRDIYIQDCIIDNEGYHGIIIAQGERIFIERCILNGCGISSRGNSSHITRCKASDIHQYFALSALYDTDLVYEKTVISECEVLNNINAVFSIVENCKCNGIGNYTGYKSNKKVMPLFRGCQAAMVDAAVARYEDCEIISTDNNAVNIQANQVEFVRCKFRVPRFATGGTAVIRCEGCEIVGYVSGNDGLGFQTDYFVNNHIITESPNGTTKLNFKPVGKVCRIEKNTYEGQYYYSGLILTKASLAVAEIVTLKDNTFLCTATGAGKLFKVNVQLKDCKIYAERNVISASGNWEDFNIDASILATDKLKIFTDGNMQVGGGTFTEITDTHISRLTWTPSV